MTLIKSKNKEYKMPITKLYQFQSIEKKKDVQTVKLWTNKVPITCIKNLCGNHIPTNK